MSDGGVSAQRRVLVVDDDHDSAIGLAMLLQADGHLVRTAADGSAALAEASSFAPELVILDLALGDMSGYELAKELRRRLGDRPVLVALTGFDGETVVRQCHAAGIDRHMVKPIVDFAQMRGFVRSLEVGPGEAGGLP